MLLHVFVVFETLHDIATMKMCFFFFFFFFFFGGGGALISSVFSLVLGVVNWSRPPRVLRRFTVLLLVLTSVFPMIDCTVTDILVFISWSLFLSWPALVCIHSSLCLFSVPRVFVILGFPTLCLSSPAWVTCKLCYFLICLCFLCFSCCFASFFPYFLLIIFNRRFHGGPRTL